MLATSATAMQTHKAPEREPCGHKYAEHRHGIADAKHTRNLERLRHFAHCARTDHKRERIRNRIENIKREREQAKAEAASLTPYDCGSYGSFAIPCHIVACESHYSWSAYNSSGAAGPYQIMPEWGRPWPVTSEADRLAHHRIAADIWAGGSGSGNWVCAG